MQHKLNMEMHPFMGQLLMVAPLPVVNYTHKNKLTAAHKTLPLGTVIKVTNAHNKKSVL